MIQAIITLLGMAGPLLERIIPDPNKRLELTMELQKLALENQASLNTAMADVMKADAASGGLLTRNARPFAVFWAIFMVSYVGVIAPLFGIQKETIDGLQAVPSELWNIIAVFGGGYILAKAGVEIVKATKSK